MRIIRSKKAMTQYADALRQKGERLVFVPTMGYLHQGHLALVRRARRLGDRVAVSIYVNPTQFGPSEDFKRYPKNIRRDISMLKGEHVDVLFLPQELYLPGSVMRVDPGPLALPLCGKFRPGHFSGVATVVLKLLQIVRPHAAVFGQKDAQQFAVLKRMVLEFDLGVRMTAAPIVREPDGLALSSRNTFLSARERALAPSLYRALSYVKSAFRHGRPLAGPVLVRASKIPLGRLQYLEAVDASTLQPVKRLGKGVLVAGSMKLGKTRLIDNILL